MTDPCKGCITAWERGGKQSFIGLSLCFGSGCLLEGQEFLLVYAFVLEKASPKINAGKGLHPYLHWGSVKRTCSIQPGLLLLLGSQTMMAETFLMPDLHACWVPLLRSSNYKSTKKKETFGYSCDVCRGISPVLGLCCFPRFCWRWRWLHS